MSRARWLANTYLIVIYVFLFVPAVFVVLFSFNDSQFWSFPLKGFTVRWYVQLIDRPDAMTALWNSVMVAIATVVLSVALGGSAAVAFHRWRVRAATLAEGIMLLPQLIPTLIWGLGLLLMLTALQTPMGAPTVILGHVLYNTPYVFLLVRARYHSLDPNLELAARGLGESPLGAFRRIVLPHLAPSLIAGALLSFAVSFSDVVIAFLLSGGGFNTLPVFIYSLIQNEPSSIINAVASIVFVVALSGMLGALLFIGREAALLGGQETRG
jgi:spermidine/putrescine transport system permease protein